MDNHDKVTLIIFFPVLIGLVLFGIFIIDFNTPPQSDFNKESISLDKNCVVKEKIVEKVFNPFLDLNCSNANQVDLNKWITFDLREKSFFSLNYSTTHFLKIVYGRGKSMSPIIKNEAMFLVDTEYGFENIEKCDIIAYYNFDSNQLITHFVQRTGFDENGFFAQTMGINNGFADLPIRSKNFYGKVIAVLNG